jgi:uncharacterized protein YbjT (DUF2867 family)
MKIVVIGGTGLIGSKLVAKLQKGGHEPLAASPNTGVDSLTGEGVAEALEGAQVVVDVSNAPFWDDAAVLDFFQTSTHNVLAAEVAAGVGHHVAASVVGADRLADSGYLRAKVAQEDLIKAGTIPYTIVRATQFFEFIGRIADSGANGDTVRLSPALMSADRGRGRDSRTGRRRLERTPQRHGGSGRPRCDPSRRARPTGASRKQGPSPGDSRAHARYFGAELDDRSLTPGDDARIAPTRFEDWLTQSAN